MSLKTRTLWNPEPNYASDPSRAPANKKSRAPANKKRSAPALQLLILNQRQLMYCKNRGTRSLFSFTIFSFLRFFEKDLFKCKFSISEKNWSERKRCLSSESFSIRFQTKFKKYFSSVKTSDLQNNKYIINLKLYFISFVIFSFIYKIVTHQ